MKNRYRILIVAFLAVGVSFAAGVVALGEAEITARFWVIILPVLFSEALLAASFAGLAGKSKAKSFPMKVAANLLPWLYFAFTLVMIAAYSSKMSNSGILAWQAAALFLTLLFIVLAEMAGDAITADAVEQKLANLNRTNFKLSVAALADAAKAKFPDKPGISSLMAKCEDAIRYSADSPPGAEQADAEIEKNLDAADMAVAAADENALVNHLTSLLAALRKREAIIKTLR